MLTSAIFSFQIRVCEANVLLEVRILLALEHTTVCARNAMDGNSGFRRNCKRLAAVASLATSFSRVFLLLSVFIVELN